MATRIAEFFRRFSYLPIWLILTAGITYTSFHIHATIIACALFAINTPVLRPTGWNTATIYGLSRLVWLLIGIAWLVGVMYTEADLREGRDQGDLIPRAKKYFLITLAVFASCYLVLLLL